MNDSSDLTRRSLLCTGATGAETPGHLTRSAYAGREGSSFRVEARPALLPLESVTLVVTAVQAGGSRSSERRRLSFR